MSQQDQQLTDLPEALIQQLKAEELVNLIPRSVDETVLKETAWYFEARQEEPKKRRFLPVAAAATVLLAVLAGQSFFGPDTKVMLSDDVDGSGQVDVLDVFALARLSKTDNTVTEHRIQALLTRIVSLQDLEPST